MPDDTLPVHDYLARPDMAEGVKLLLHIPDITGGSLLAGYEGWLEVDAVSSSWVVSRDAAQAGRGRRRGRAHTPGRCMFAMPFDAGGVDLVSSAVKGRSHPIAELHHVVVGEHDARAPLVLEFRNVMIAAIRTDSLAGMPRIQLELAYEEVRLRWADFDANGEAGEVHEVEFNIETGV